MADGAPLPVICLGGPTGSGKTGIALALARALDCEIVNADSRQVYSAFPIITAQPDEAERAIAPHHLYGFLPTERKMSAGQWARMAREVAEAIAARGKIPLLVGGTGMYFQALLRGIAAIPPIPAEISQNIEARMAVAGPESLHEELGRVDPGYAALVHPRDRQRIMRALEVWEGTGRPFSWWHKNAMPPPLCAGPLLVVNTPLVSLEPRLKARIGAMLKAGAIAEARAARAACDDQAAPGWSGIGCAELLAHLRGETSLEECESKWLANTRAYAKRQITWFRQRREAVFFDPGDLPGMLAHCGQSLKDWGRYQD